LKYALQIITITQFVSLYRKVKLNSHKELE